MITEMTPHGGPTNGTWMVTFIYKGHVVKAPTGRGVNPPVDLVGKDATVDGSIARDGSFVILSITP